MVIKKDKDSFISYLEDTSNLKGDAESLYIPENIQEAEGVIEELYREGKPMTFSAARTGTTAGCVPDGGVIVSLEKLNRIVDIDCDEKRVIVEAGCTLSDLERELNGFNLIFRPQPTESLAFVGGAISTSASGLRGYKYGSVRRYVERIKVVIGEGFVIDIPRGRFKAQGRNFSFSYKGRDFRFSLPSYVMPQVKSQAGYFVVDDMDLIDLFIGSEGTLGCVLEIELKVQDIASDIFDCVVFFPQEQDGINFVTRVNKLKREGVIYPSSLEFLDRNSLELVGDKYPSFLKYGCAVYFEQELERQEDKDHIINFWCETIKNSGVSLEDCWLAENIRERRQVYEFRHAIPQRINEFLREYRQVKISSDIAVREDVFMEMYNFYYNKAQSKKIPYVNFGHIGEGHLHFNFLPRNDKEREIALKCLKEFILKGISLGGTISAEHGIGKLKRDYLVLMYGDKHIREMAITKRYFDPKGLFNRGNIFAYDMLNN